MLDPRVCTCNWQPTKNNEVLRCVGCLYLRTEIDDQQRGEKHFDADLRDLSARLNAEKLGLACNDTIEDGEQNRRRRLNGADKGAQYAAWHVCLLSLVLNKENSRKMDKSERLRRAVLYFKARSCRNITSMRTVHGGIPEQMCLQKWTETCTQQDFRLRLSGKTGNSSGNSAWRQGTDVLVIEVKGLVT